MGGPDALLAARLAAGDDHALAEIFDRLAPAVYGAALRVLGEGAAAQDVVQDVFVDLWSNPGRYDGEFAKISDMARAEGGLHHRFGIGDGFVVMIDEWETAEHFQRFFADPELQAFIGSVGAAPVPPELTITEAITSPDQY